MMKYSAKYMLVLIYYTFLNNSVKIDAYFYFTFSFLANLMGKYNQIIVVYAMIVL